MDKEDIIRETEQLIQEIRDGKREKYPEIREQLLEMELKEEDFPSEVLFRWYETIRKVEPEDFAARAGVRMTVSVTSWPGRIEAVPEALKSVYAQSKKPEEVILWLAEDAFPGKDTHLPELLRIWQEEKKLTIRWCEDLKPHKKYFWILQENKEGLTVTVDDDLLYAPDVLEMLWLSWLRHPKAVSAMRVHLMAVAEGRRLLPYREWVMETDAEPDRPGMELFATTGAGTLYPPGLLGERFFDKQAILDTCLMADDLWMKANELMEGIPVVLACRNRGLHFVPGSQEDTLWTSNREKNDEQWEKIRALIDKREGEGALEKKLSEVSLEQYSMHASRRADVLQERLAEVRTDRSRQIREKGELREKLREMREDRDRLAAELDRLHATLTFKIWRRTVEPIKKRFEK